jgi:hypothetical protein
MFSPAVPTPTIESQKAPDRHRPRRRGDLARRVVAVADHQPVTVLVELLGAWATSRQSLHRGASARSCRHQNAHAAPRATPRSPDGPGGRILVVMTTRSGAGRRHLAASPFKPQPESPIEQYAVDDRVSHDTYGLGRVIGMDEGAVTVDFGAQQVRITSPFDTMEKL